MYKKNLPEKNNHEVDIDKATILTPEGGFSDSSVLHELLHLRRIKVDGFPQLAVCDDYNCDKFFFDKVIVLDNNIEHLFIVPEEITRRPKRVKYWENQIIQNSKKQENSGLNINQHGGDAVYNWVFSNFVLKDGCAVEKTTKVIQKLKIETIANKLLSTLKEPNCTKELFSKTFLAKLGLPNGSVCFKYQDREENL